jgi:hypothetical protein
MMFFENTERLCRTLLRPIMENGANLNERMRRDDGDPGQTALELVLGRCDKCMLEMMFKYGF